MENKKDLAALKEEVLNSLDYNRIRRVMEFLDWEWSGKIPTIIDLYQELSNMMDRAVEGCEESKAEEYTIQTGGFSCTYYPKTDTTDNGFVVSFNIEEYSSFY